MGVSISLKSCMKGGQRNWEKSPDKMKMQNLNIFKEEQDMLLKMRESKGFTLVELMIVVAIIGILAAVAVPYYQRYVAKSRLTSLVMPSVHAVETNISTYYALQSEMPDLTGDSINTFLSDADTHWAKFEKGDDSYTIKITVRTTNSNKDDKFPLKAIGTANDVNVFEAVAQTSNSRL